MTKDRIYKTGAVVLALIIWQIASSLVGMEMLLASPLTVIKRLFEIVTEKDFLRTVLFSAYRVGAGFLIAFALGCVLAVLAGRSRWVELFLWPYVAAAKTVPVASFIILCIIWFNYSQLTVLISFLIAFPVIYSNFLQGIKSTDEDMLEMAELYNVSWPRKLFYVYLPSVKPYLISACGISIGMAWKAGVAAEVIGVIDGSIGEKLYESKVYFLNSDLLAWTIVIILLSVAGEKVLQWLVSEIFKWMEKR